MSEIVNIKNVSKTYQKNGQQIMALNSIDLSINKGDFFLVKGASGSGKTTFLLMIGGMLQPSQGDLNVLGMNLNNLSDGEKVKFRADNIGFIFQMFHLIPYLNIRENILINNEVNSSKIGAQELEDLAEELGLSHRLSHYPSELSAGEKQRVALARALIKKPELILADEPTGNLDQGNSQIVLQKLKEYCDNGGTVVMVSHDNHPDTFANELLTIGISETVNQA
ncbi:MAG: putative ABC transport system ATP-binding protein [Cyclobacteriaceae bacterium]|jgi:ABC-type lipoprotein export system ATPase subunit